MSCLLESSEDLGPSSTNFSDEKVVMIKTEPIIEFEDVVGENSNTSSQIFVKQEPEDEEKGSFEVTEPPTRMEDDKNQDPGDAPMKTFEVSIRKPETSFSRQPFTWIKEEPQDFEEYNDNMRTLPQRIKFLHYAKRALETEVEKIARKRGPYKKKNKLNREAKLERRRQWYRKRYDYKKKTMTPEEQEFHRAKMRLYNRTRYAQMTEEERKAYLALNLERGRIRKAKEYGERQPHEKVSTKEMSEEVTKILEESYEKDPRPKRDVLNALAVETGMFWLTIRRWFERKRWKERYNIGEYSDPNVRHFTPQITQKLLAVFQIAPSPNKELVAELCLETGIDSARMMRWFRGRRALVKREEKEAKEKRAYVKFSPEALDFLEHAYNTKPPRAENGYYQSLADAIGYNKEKIREWFIRRRKQQMKDNKTKSFSVERETSIVKEEPNDSEAGTSEQA